MKAVTRTLMTLGLCLPGAAVMWGTGVTAPSSPAIDRFLSNAKLNRAKVLVVIQDEKGLWAPAFGAAFREDALQDYVLRPALLKADSDLGRAFLGRLGWETGPGWAILDHEGKVLQADRQLPSAPGLAAAMRAAGVRRPIPDLEAFLKAHPGHGDALAQLLDLYKRRALDRMAPLLAEDSSGGSIHGGSVGASFGGAVVVNLNGGRAEKTPRLLRPLTPAEDARIWGPLATLLPELFQTPSWELSGVTLPPAARHSALLKAACRRLLPEVESVLRRHPSQEGPWRTWVSLGSVAGAQSLRRFLNTLEPLPGAQEVPPSPVLAAFVAECQGAKAWAELRDLMEPRWKADRDPGILWVTGTGDLAQSLHKARWDHVASPLVEACLHLGDTEAADRVVQEAARRFPGRSLPTWASQLALKTGHVDLARAWSALSVAPR